MNFHLIRGKNSSKSSQKALDLTNLKKCFYGVMVFLLAPVLREKWNFTYYLGGISFKIIVHPFGSSVFLIWKKQSCFFSSKKSPFPFIFYLPFFNILFKFSFFLKFTKINFAQSLPKIHERSSIKVN